MRTFFIILFSFNMFITIVNAQHASVTPTSETHQEFLASIEEASQAPSVERVETGAQQVVTTPDAPIISIGEIEATAEVPKRSELEGDYEFIGIDSGKRKPEQVAKPWLGHSHLSKFCEREASDEWKNITMDDRARGERTFLGSLNEFHKSIKEQKASGEEVDIASLSTKGQDVIKTILLCEAYRSMFNHTNYEDQHMQDPEETVGNFGAASMLSCSNQANPQECMAQVQGQQENSACRQNGFETQDFITCKRMMNTITGFVLGKQGLTTIQGVRAQSAQADIQMDLQEQQQSGEGISHKDVLSGQRESVQQQAKLANEQFVLDAAQAGTLGTMLATMPTKETLLNECDENTNGHVFYTQVFQIIAREHGLDETVPSDVRNLQDACTSVFQIGKTGLIMNEAARDHIKQAMIQAGMGALANAAKSHLLNKQADNIKDLIQDWDVPAEPDFQTFQEEEALFSECLADPTKEGCIPPVAGSTSHGMLGQNISIGNPDYGSSAATGLENLNESNSAAANNSGLSDSKSLPTTFGGIPESTSQNTDFQNAPPPAGRMKKSEGGGAGGGGGGAGVGSTSITGSKAQGMKSKEGGGSKGIRTATIATRGGKFSLAGGGGLRGNAKKTSSANPFGKLFNKNKRDPANKKMDFSIDKNKGASIFDRLTNRHMEVIKEKNRLLEYEVVNAP